MWKTDSGSVDKHSEYSGPRPAELGFVIVLRVEVNRAECIENEKLLTAVNRLRKGVRDRFVVGLMATRPPRVFLQAVAWYWIGRHGQILTQWCMQKKDLVSWREVSGFGFAEYLAFLFAEHSFAATSLETFAASASARRISRNRDAFASGFLMTSISSWCL
jgi:hypothetical protein